MAKKFKRPSQTGNAYIDSCFQFELVDLDESRVWHEIDGLIDIPSLQDTDKKKALALAEASLPKFPDYDFVYVWIGRLKGQLGYPGEPQNTYLEGIKKCRMKSSLCANLGSAEFEANQLEEAVRWWLISCTIQLNNRVLDWVSFLNLAYIAEGLSLSHCHSVLLKEADRFQSVRYSADTANERYHLATTQGNDSIKQAIVLLCDCFL